MRKINREILNSNLPIAVFILLTVVSSFSASADVFCSSIFSSPKIVSNAASPPIQSKSSLEVLIENLNTADRKLQQAVIAKDLPRQSALADKMIQNAVQIFQNRGIGFEILHADDRKILQLTGSGKTDVDRLTASLLRRFDYKVVYDPFQTRGGGAEAQVDPANRQLRAPISLVLEGAIDSSMVHEIRHIHQRYVWQKTLQAGTGDALLSGYISGWSAATHLQGTYEKGFSVDEISAYMTNLYFASNLVRQTYREMKKPIQDLEALKAQRDALKEQILQMEHDKSSILAKMTDAINAGHIPTPAEQQEIVKDYEAMRAKTEESRELVTQMDQRFQLDYFAIKQKLAANGPESLRENQNFVYQLSLIEKMATSLEEVASKFKRISPAESSWKLENPVIYSTNTGAIVFYARTVHEANLGISPQSLTGIPYLQITLTTPGTDASVLTFPVSAPEIVNKYLAAVRRNGDRGAAISDATKLQDVVDHIDSITDKYSSFADTVKSALKAVNNAIWMNDPVQFDNSLRELRQLVYGLYYP